MQPDSLSSSPAPEQPADALTRLAFGFRNTQALYVVAKLGVADLISGGPLGYNEIAKKLNVKPRPLFRVMRALAAQGVFTHDTSDRFGLTPISQHLRSDSPQSLRYMVISQGEEAYGAAGELMHTVRTGETAFDHIHGKGHFEYLRDNEEASKTFNMFMTQSTRRFDRPLGTYDFGGRSRLVDVGGGQGAVLAKILLDNPGMNGILFDLPQGVADARRYLESQGVADRCRIETGNFFESVPEGGDFYLLSRILHDWPDDKAGMILASVRKAIKRDGILLIRDAVIPEGDVPSLAKQVDLTMLFMLGGAERTEKEWRRLLHDSGFELKKVLRFGMPFDLIEAAPT